MNTLKLFSIVILFIIINPIAIFSTNKNEKEIENNQATIIYVDGANGNDSNLGSKEKPLLTIKKAFDLVNMSKIKASIIIKIAPGLYNLTETAVLNGNEVFTENNRLIIQSSILPEDTDWLPSSMPVFYSSATKKKDQKDMVNGFQIETNHVTIRGLKFIGHPNPSVEYFPIRRNGDSLSDLNISQCLFVSDKHSLPIHVAIIANGHKLQVDHCLFWNCETTIIFWNAKEGLSKGNKMQYNIINGSYISGTWVCQTDEDFEFNNNILSNCNFAWIKEAGNNKKYTLKNCVFSNNDNFLGFFSSSSGITKSEELEKEFKFTGITYQQKIDYELDKNKRNYLHPISDNCIKAGLFK